MDVRCGAPHPLIPTPPMAASPVCCQGVGAGVGEDQEEMSHLAQVEEAMFAAPMVLSDSELQAQTQHPRDS